jgi:predicted metalloprotease with PDZ domain
VAGPPGRTVDREIETQLVRLAGDVQVGKFTFERPHGALTETSERSPLLGGRVLDHFAVTLDARNARLRLARTDDQPIQPPAMRILGFMTKGTDRGQEIWSVMPGSPAAKAGLAKGDIVLECAGRAMDEWQWAGAMDELVRQPRVTLKVQRGSDPPREIEFDVLELVPAAS